MRGPRLHWLGFAALIVLIVLSGVTEFTAPPATEHEASDAPDLVEPVPNGSSLWPYTSRTRSFETRRLGINLIVRGDPAAVRQYLLRHSRDPPDQPSVTEESPKSSSAEDPLEALGVEWRVAHGGTRYTYVESGNEPGEGRWLAESYQLYDGTYLGSRFHIRAFESMTPGEDWTAMQAHQEHWDWFRLRHTVTSTRTARQHVEADLIDDTAVDTVWRMHLDNGDTADSDGWATVIEFALFLFVAGIIRPLSRELAASWRRLTARLRPPRGGRARHQALLFAAIIAILLGVRLLGVTLEETFTAVSPTDIAAGLYLFLVLGLPIGTAYLARRVQMEAAFLVTVIAFMIAAVLDLAYLGLTVVPFDFILHRATLLLSLGLIAAGSAYDAQGGPRWNELLQIGGVGWMFAIVLPLLGFI